MFDKNTILIVILLLLIVLFWQRKTKEGMDTKGQIPQYQIQQPQLPQLPQLPKLPEPTPISCKTTKPETDNALELVNYVMKLEKCIIDGFPTSHKDQAVEKIRDILLKLKDLNLITQQQHDFITIYSMGTFLQSAEKLHKLNITMSEFDNNFSLQDDINKMKEKIEKMENINMISTNLRQRISFDRTKCVSVPMPYHLDYNCANTCSNTQVCGNVDTYNSQKVFCCLDQTPKPLIEREKSNQEPMKKKRPLTLDGDGLTHANTQPQLNNKVIANPFFAGNNPGLSVKATRG